MTKPCLVVLLLACFVKCCAQSQPGLSVIKNNPDFKKIFFLTGDNLLLYNTYNLSRIEIKSDTKYLLNQNKITYYSGKSSGDTISVGTFTTPGLYVVKYGISKKSDNYDHVLKDSIWKWQIPGYIHYQLSGGAYLGVSWKIGSENSLLDSNQIYVYNYAQGKIFSDLDVSSVLMQSKPQQDDQTLSRLYDSLQFAFSNVNFKYLTERLHKLGENLSAIIDSGNNYQFSFYMTKQNFVRVLVAPTLNNIDTSKILCRTILDSLVDIFSFDSLSVRETDGSLKKVPLISCDLSAVLKLTIESALFEKLPDNYFSLSDSNNVENSLRAFDSSYDSMTSTVWSNVIYNNTSQQIMLSANIIGSKTSHISKTVSK